MDHILITGYDAPEISALKYIYNISFRQRI